MCIDGAQTRWHETEGSHMHTTPTNGDTTPASGRRRPGQTVECGWCGQPVRVPSRGRIPSWCSSSCRHRAWEARKAERDNLPEVRVVTRTIEVEKPVSHTVEVPVPVEPRTADE